MELGSNEMIFTRNELQNIANGLVLLMKFDEENKPGLGSNFIEVFNLLNRFNEQIDNIDMMEGEKIMNTNIIAVKYEDKFIPRTFGGKSYSYFTIIKLNEGDIVKAPTQNGTSIARVSRVNIPEDEIKDIKPYMKTITKKINRDRYLKFAEIQEEVA